MLPCKEDALVHSRLALPPVLAFVPTAWSTSTLGARPSAPTLHLLHRFVRRSAARPPFQHSAHQIPPVPDSCPVPPCRARLVLCTSLVAVRREVFGRLSPPFFCLLDFEVTLTLVLWASFQEPDRGGLPARCAPLPVSITPTSHS